MKIVITGGAGFIGANATAHFLERGDHVVVLDNLSRRGAEDNLRWLREREGDLSFVKADVRDDAGLVRALSEHRDADAVIHLAAQVAVTTSVTDPRTDFQINALGTLNALEGARELPNLRAFVFASTNKVYGEMTDVTVIERNGRYEYESLADGVSELRPLDFHSPYGCSKGAADQYVIDYARIYGMPTVAFRQSCIYGPRQFGIEDQGWLAWFCIAAVTGQPITIYGDGKQVRDVLHVRDLVRAYAHAIERIDAVSGRAFNMGGGPAKTLSLLELLAMLERLLGRPIPHTFSEWRPGDQRVFVADVAKAFRELDWVPEVDVEDGVSELLSWVRENEQLVQPAAAGNRES